MATNIVDHIRVPEDLEPGQYLLSWRWDVEQVRWLGGSLSWHSLDYLADMICGVILNSCSHKLACSICSCRNAISYRWYWKFLYLYPTHPKPQMHMRVFSIYHTDPPDLAKLRGCDYSLSTLWTWIKQIAEGNLDRYILSVSRTMLLFLCLNYVHIQLSRGIILYYCCSCK